MKSKMYPVVVLLSTLLANQVLALPNKHDARYLIVCEADTAEGHGRCSSRLVLASDTPITTSVPVALPSSSLAVGVTTSTDTAASSSSSISITDSTASASANSTTTTSPSPMSTMPANSTSTILPSTSSPSLLPNATATSNSSSTTLPTTEEVLSARLSTYCSASSANQDRCDILTTIILTCVYPYSSNSSTCSDPLVRYIFADIINSPLCATASPDSLPLELCQDWETEASRCAYQPQPAGDVNGPCGIHHVYYLLRWLRTFLGLTDAGAATVQGDVMGEWERRLRVQRKI